MVQSKVNVQAIKESRTPGCAKVRNANETERAIFNTNHKPVKARLATKWEDWPYIYFKPEFVESFM